MLALASIPIWIKLSPLPISNSLKNKPVCYFSKCIFFKYIQSFKHFNYKIQNISKIALLTQTWVDVVYNFFQWEPLTLKIIWLHDAKLPWQHSKREGRLSVRNTQQRDNKLGHKLYSPAQHPRCTSSIQRGLDSHPFPAASYASSEGQYWRPVATWAGAAPPKQQHERTKENQSALNPP